MFIPFMIEETGYEAKHSPFCSTAFCLAYLVFGGAAFGALPGSTLEDMAYAFGYVPMDFKWWTPLTCTFIHGHWEHLLGNLAFFWIYGRGLERHLGTPRFLLIYIIGAYASVLAHGLTSPEWLQDEPAIGASGAISAVLGAFLAFMPNAQMRFIVFSPFSGRPLPSIGPAHFVIGTWFLLQIFYGLKVVGDVGQIAFWAHIAGFGAGALVAELMILASRLAEAHSDKDAKPQLSAVQKANAIWRSGEKEQALREAVAAFAREREAGGSGEMLQLYAWLALGEGADERELPPWVHRDAIAPAIRLRSYELALHAIAEAASLNTIDDAQKALSSMKLAIKRLG